MLNNWFSNVLLIAFIHHRVLSAIKIIDSDGNVPTIRGANELDPLEQMIHDIFDPSGASDNNDRVIKTVTNDQLHHKTTTRTVGPGFETVVVTQVLGGGNHHNPNDPIIIPIFQNSRKIHLKRVNQPENPFKIFQDLDSIFESFLDGFAKGIAEDEIKHHNKANKELKNQIDRMEHDIKHENVVVTNVRDITNEVKDKNLPTLSHDEINHEERKPKPKSSDLKEELKHVDPIKIVDKEKKTSWFAKIMKIILYGAFIIVAIFLAKFLLSKMNYSGESEALHPKIEATNINSNTKADIKSKENKYY